MQMASTQKYRVFLVLGFGFLGVGAVAVGTVSGLGWVMTVGGGVVVGGGVGL